MFYRKQITDELQSSEYNIHELPPLRVANACVIITATIKISSIVILAILTWI